MTYNTYNTFFLQKVPQEIALYLVLQICAKDSCLKLRKDKDSTLLMMRHHQGMLDRAALSMVSDTFEEKHTNDHKIYIM